MSEGEGGGWRQFLKSLRIKGREADLSKVSVLKIAEAAKERGIRVDFTLSEPGPEGKVHGVVEKVVVAGDDEAS